MDDGDGWDGGEDVGWVERHLNPTRLLPVMRLSWIAGNLSSV
ncbi:hypothetical protein [Limnofasciculus baicalensis]|nr:hypothetical protein [Limnofasciculus baicalensis]